MATQEFMTMKMEEYLKKDEELTKALKTALMSQRTKSHKDRDITPVIIGRKTAKAALEYFAPKTAVSNNGQFDASNLKQILLNCKVFDGWVDHQSSNGWLQTFHNYAKMRNNVIGHNNALTLTDSQKNDYLKVIKDLFKQLYQRQTEISSIIRQSERIRKLETEIENLQANHFGLTTSYSEPDISSNQPVDYSVTDEQFDNLYGKHCEKGSITFKTAWVAGRHNTVLPSVYEMYIAYHNVECAKNRNIYNQPMKQLTAKSLKHSNIIKYVDSNFEIIASNLFNLTGKTFWTHRNKLEFNY